MQFDTSDKQTILALAGIGAFLAVGQLLVGGKPLTWRLWIGRLIVGAGLSMAAGAALMMIPDLPPIALVGLGSALGISGQSILECLVQRWTGAPHHHHE